MPIRKESEIQAAHDRLTAIVLGEVPIWTANTESVTAALDVLCWVLGHDHNQTFAENLRTIDDTLAERGFVLSEVPHADS
jgi:hypothetical protein